MWAYGAFAVAEVNIVAGVNSIDHAVKGVRKPHAKVVARITPEKRKFQ
jgi:hypothetical protein